MPPDELREAFAKAGVDPGRPVVTTCGSGVTASVLALALHRIGHRTWRCTTARGRSGARAATPRSSAERDGEAVARLVWRSGGRSGRRRSGAAGARRGRARAWAASPCSSAGDRVAVGVSGGKDSLCLLHALVAYRRRAPFPYDVIAVTVEQGKFKASDPRARRHDRARSASPGCVRDEPATLRLVADGVVHGCDVCSRHRRRALYTIAGELGCTVLALGHTADDCAEALLRNILFNGRIASLPPVARSRKGGLRLIRPLAFVTEALTTAYARALGLSTGRLRVRREESVRREIRAFLTTAARASPRRAESITAALGNVNPYTLFDPDADQGRRRRAGERAMSDGDGRRLEGPGRRLEGKIAIVTGAGTGIGRATALMLAAEGAAVVVVGRRRALLDAVVAEVEREKGRAVARVCDLEKNDETRELAAWTVATLGRVDILVNNAGHSSRARNIRWVREDEWRSVLAVNLDAVYVLTQAVLPGMLERREGTIVTVASLAADRPGLVGGAPYGAAKAAVRNLMGHVHTVYRNQGIRATTIVARRGRHAHPRRPAAPAERAGSARR